MNRARFLSSCRIALKLTGARRRSAPLVYDADDAGHAKIETTYAYTHVLPGMQEQAAETFERLILGS